MARNPSRAALALALSSAVIAALPVAAQSVSSQYPRPALIRPGVVPVDPTVRPPVIVRATPCPTGDCVAQSVATQDECAMFDRQATGDPRWAAGLSLDADQDLFVERGLRQWNVQSYRIRWSNGAWSEWFVAGLNDVDFKFNPGPNTMRRMWSYFADHEHQALACHRRQ